MTTTDPGLASDVAPEFTCDESDALKAIAACIIPASPLRGLPSASDPAIFRGFVDAVSKRGAELTPALQEFKVLQRTNPQQAGAIFQKRFSDAARTLQSLVAQSYYSDPRVMLALGMEVRPPFPQGFELEQGDWSLLAPVKSLPPF